MIANRYLEKA